MPGPYDYSTPLAQAQSLPQPQEGAAIMQGIQNGLELRMQQFKNAYQMQELQRNLTLQQQQDAAQQTALADPTPENIVKWSIAAPDHFQAANVAHSARTADEQRQNIQDAASVYGYLQPDANGNPANLDGATKIVQQRVDAGQTNLQPLLGMLQSGNPAQIKAAAGVVGAQLAAQMGPDQFANAYSKVGAPGVAQQQAETEKTQAETQTTLHPPAKTEVVQGQTDASGNPIFYNPNAAPPATPLPADLTSWASKVDASENPTGNPGAQNPRSTATGNGQFIDGTWLQMVKATRPDLAAGKTDPEILALRNNPQLSQQVTAAYGQVNGHALQAAGLPVNGATLTLAHRFGPGGAQTILNADPNAQLSAILPKSVMVANPDLRGVTAGQYAQHLAGQFGTNPISIGTDASNTQALTGDAFLRTLPPARANLIRSIANGDTPAPTGRAAAQGPGAVLLQQVLQYDPSASAINLPTRQATRVAFTSGPEGQAIASINTVTGHLVKLDHAIDNLSNTNVPLWNEAAQAIGGQVGDTKTQARVADFNVAKTNVANELTKVFRGSGGAEADIQGWLKQLQADESPVALHATVQAMVEAMGSRLQGLGAQYSQGMGRTTDPLQLVTPATAKALTRLSGGGQSAQPQGGQRVAVNPQTGQRVAYDPTSNSWKPI
jgi:hypothetical protein